MRRFLPLVLVCVSTFANAQETFDSYVSNIVILQAKAVQNDVGITQAQRAKMNTIADADRAKREALLKQYQKEAEAAKKAGKNYQPDQSKLASLNLALKRNILALMAPAQIKRLRELSLQNAGITALMDDRVAKEAGVSSVTTAKLRNDFQTGSQKAAKIQETESQKVFALYKDRKPKNATEAAKLRDEAYKKLSVIVGPKIAQVQAQTKSKMESELTAPQRAKFTALQGKPFKG